MKKLIIGFMMILSLSGGLFAQNIGEKTGNAFWDYMHGGVYLVLTSALHYMQDFLILVLGF